MPDAADLTVFSFSDGSDFRRFLMTEVGRLHVVGSFSHAFLFFTLFAVPPVRFYPIVVFIPGIVGDTLLLRLFGLLRAIVFYRVYWLQRIGEPFIRRLVSRRIVLGINQRSTGQ